MGGFFMRETLTIESKELLDAGNRNAPEDIVQLYEQDIKVSGPLATLYLPLGEKVTEHMKQFKQWQEKTVASGKPLNGIYPQHQKDEQIQLQQCEEVVLFQNCDPLTKVHLENFAVWEAAAVAAGKPLSGVQKNK
jgi:hypothetical protein